MVRLGAYAETAQGLWHDFWAALRERGLADDATGAYGFGMDHPGHTPTPLCRYVAAIALPAIPDDIPGSFRFTLPGGRYGVYRLKGPYSQIKEAFPQLRDDWLPASGHAVDVTRPFLEVYVNDPKTVAESEILTDLCIPIGL